MGVAENIFVVYDSIDVRNHLSRFDQIKPFLVQRCGLLLGITGRFDSRPSYSIWLQDAETLDFWKKIEIRGFPFWQRGELKSRGEFESRSPATVRDSNGDYKVFTDGKVRRLKSENPKPSTLVDIGSVTSLIYGAGSGIGGVSVSAIDFDRIGSIDTEHNQPKKLQPKRHIVEPVLSLFAGILALGLGWWKLKFCDSLADLCYGFGSLLSGLFLTTWGVLIF